MTALPDTAGRPSVLVQATSLRPDHDGARTVLVQLLDELPRAWPEARWLLTVPRGSGVAPAGWEVVEVRSGRAGLMRAAEDLLLLPRIAARLAPDVILTPNETIPHRIRGRVVVVAQNAIYHCPAVSAADAGHWRYRLQFAFYRAQAPRAYRRADAVIAVSEHLAELLVRRAGLAREKVTVVPEGADGVAAATSAGDRPASRRLLLVGTLAPYKRVDVALRALAQLQDEGSGYELVAIGGGWPGHGEALDRLARELGVARSWRREGIVTAEELARAYAGAFALVALSSCESFGLPVAEAMRTGLPVIAADEPWSRETGGDAAIHVPPEPRALATAVRVLEETAAWRARSAAGRARAGELTWAAAARGIVGVLRGVAGRGSAGA